MESAKAAFSPAWTLTSSSLTATPPPTSRPSRALTASIVQAKRFTQNSPRPLGVEANTVVELAALRNLWRATINTGPSLSYTGPLWQRGLIAATVRLAGSEFRTSRVIGSNDLGQWNIIVPDRKLSGTVRDEESGQPIPGTYIQYDFEGSDEWVRGAHLDIDQNGRFQLFGAREGTYIIRVTAPGHVLPDPVRVSIDENTSEPHVDIALKRQATRDLILVDAATGERIAGAPVVELIPDGRSIARMLTTDGSGMVSVGLPGKQPMTLYVLPPAGSLKVVHLFDAPDNEPMRVEVPPPASSIELKAQFDDGTPIQGCRVLMRINGETIPPVIMELLASILHVAVVSGSGGEMSLPAMPTGLYEFWPYLASSSIPVPTSAPIRANIEAGQSSIVLTFDRQHG